MIAAILHRGQRGEHRYATGIGNRQGLQLARIGLVVGVAEVGHGVGVACRAGHEHVVVFAALHIGTGVGFIAVDRLIEVVEGAGITPRSAQAQGAVGPVVVDLVPAVDFALGVLRPGAGQLPGGDCRCPVVGAVDHHGERIEGQGQFDEGDAVFSTGLEFRAADRPGGIGDWDFAGAELAQASTGAHLAQLQLHPAAPLSVAIGLDGLFSDREHGAGAADADWGTSLRASGSAGRQKGGQGGQQWSQSSGTLGSHGRRWQSGRLAPA